MVLLNSKFNLKQVYCIEMQSTSQKKAKIGEEQKALLIDLIEQNTELRSGKFSSTFTYKTSQNCWKEIALQLNAMGPVQKDWNQWRKVCIINLKKIKYLN